MEYVLKILLIPIIVPISFLATMYIAEIVTFILVKFALLGEDKDDL